MTPSNGIEPAPGLSAGPELLRRLVEIPSVSGREGAAIAFLVDWMAAHGFSAHRDEAGNAVGSMAEGDGGAGGGTVRDIILLGHIDTVPGFPPVELRDGRLYGRGAVDAKGPLAAFAAAVAAVGPQPGWRMIVVGAVEEECATSKGARALIGRYRPAMAVIGEPTGWRRVALGYKGRLLADLTVVRPMAHRAGPAPSAAELAVDTWTAVRTRLNAVNAERRRPWEQVQASLRAIASSDDGLRETAEMTMGFRLPLDFGPEQMKALLVSLESPGDLRFYGAETAYRCDKNTPLVRAFLSAIRTNGGDPSFVYKTGTSDMNVVGPAWACPILAFGPGDSMLDHTPDEHVEIAEWQRGVEVLVAALQRITGGGDPST